MNQETSADENNINLGIAVDNESSQSHQFQNLRGCSDNISDKSNSFVNIGDENAKNYAKKSKVIWTLSKSKKEKLSSDRLQRVQKGKSVCRRLEFVNVAMEHEPIYKAVEIKIGDWCIFRNEGQNIQSTYLMGNVLALQYINGKTNKEKQYSLDYAPVRHESNIRGVEVPASWYSMDPSGAVISHAVCSFINIERYVANLMDIVIEKHEDKLISLSRQFIMKIQSELLQFQS